MDNPEQLQEDPYRARRPDLVSDPPSEVSDTPAPASKPDRGPGELQDVKQLGLFAALASLSYVFWICGGMEMVERLAYYGVKAVAALYATDAQSRGGLGLSPSDFGWILTIWALIQSFLPVFTGGLSDRYGYKETIFVSTLIKISGYLCMGLFPTLAGFMGGAILLATGTAVFKPGIQGTLVNSTTRENSSMAWGVFYQTVNIGGFIGPLLAAFLRNTLSWTWVFYACAAIICCNFLLLLTYREPNKAARLARAKSAKEAGVQGDNLLVDSLRELVKPHVWRYLILFSGFWFMFNSLFDVLPLHLRDWVDTSTIVSDLFGAGGTQNGFFKFMLGMNAEGTEVNPEGMLNLNAGLIMLTCFVFAWVSGLMRATTSMVVGTLLATAAMFMSGYSSLGWFSVGAILVFSVGEMLSSPKFSEFIGNFAPEGKKAMYLGFSQIPLGIGWTLEGLLATRMYDHMASKERFSRELLLERGMSAEAVEKIPGGEAFSEAVKFLGQTPQQVTEQLYAAHNVGLMWLVMGGIGIASAIGIYWYGKWILTLARRPAVQQG